MEMLTNYNTENWYNKWTGNWITPHTDIVKISELVPINQVIFTGNILEDTASLVFELYDRERNQVFFFDIFLDRDENQNLGNSVVDPSLV